MRTGGEPVVGRPLGFKHLNFLSEGPLLSPVDNVDEFLLGNRKAAHFKLH